MAAAIRLLEISGNAWTSQPPTPRPIHSHPSPTRSPPPSRTRPAPCYRRFNSNVIGSHARPRGRTVGAPGEFGGLRGFAQGIAGPRRDAVDVVPVTGGQGIPAERRAASACGFMIAGVTSVLAAFSGSAEQLIVTLALIGTLFHDPVQRGRRIIRTTPPSRVTVLGQ